MVPGGERAGDPGQRRRAADRRDRHLEAGPATRLAPSFGAVCARRAPDWCDEQQMGPVIGYKLLFLLVFFSGMVTALLIAQFPIAFILTEKGNPCLKKP
jgi:hypothetical protein